MTGSCPVSAHVCRETARERDELRRWKAEALPVLDGLQELGKALGLPLGSRITGTEALAAVERLTRERDEARAKGDLSVDIEATATGQRCTVKRMGVTLFRGVSLEATLTTEAHDRQVAAKALREAAEEVYGDDRAAGPYSHPLSAASWLRERADRIEREAGESDADA